MSLLVTGASGHLGRRVVHHLKAAGHEVLAGSRTPAEGGRRVDFDDPDLAKAFEGVRRLLIISTDALDEPGKRLRQHLHAIEAAEAAGVEHIVYTSFLNARPDNPAVVTPDHLGTEARLAASPLSFTILRNSLYAEVPLMGLDAARATGSWFHATQGGKTSYVTREDCARAAAAALASEDTRRTVVDITGPEAVSAETLAGLLSTATGQALAPVSLSEEQLVAGMVEGGMPEPFARAMATFDRCIAEGWAESVSDGVRALTGSDPEPLGSFLARALG